MNSAIKTLLFIIVSLTWGTTWLAMKIAGTTIPRSLPQGYAFSVQPHCYYSPYTTHNPPILP